MAAASGAAAAVAAATPRECTLGSGLEWCSSATDGRERLLPCLSPGRALASMVELVGGVANG